MNATAFAVRASDAVAEPQPEHPRHSRRLHAADVLTPVALVLWVVSIGRTHTSGMNDFGLLPVLPLIWYGGLALALSAFVLELGRDTPSTPRLLGSFGVILLIVYGTSPALFELPRYNWVYKHLGMVKQLQVEHRLHPSVDIYQQWPGFFAGAAWLTSVTGVRDPIVLAKWTQVVINAVVCVELLWVFRLLGLGRRTRWLAALVFVLGNWVAQDYFSPQAVAYVFALAVAGVIVGWLLSDEPGGSRAALAAWRVDERVRRLVRAQWLPALDPEAAAPRGALPVGPVALCLIVFTACVVTHQLTPYLLIFGVGILTVTGRIKPWWLVVGLVAIAGGYLLPHYSYIANRYGSLIPRSFDFFGNTRGNAISSGGLPGRHMVAELSRDLSLVIWFLAAVGAVYRYRQRRPLLVICIFAAAPAALFFYGSYGGEAIFRVYLFSLPWAAALAACGILGGTESRRRALVGGAVAAAVLGSMLVCVVFGAERLNHVWPQDHAAADWFYDHAPAGSSLVLAAPNFPVRDSFRYSQFLVTAGDFEPNLMSDRRLRHRMFDSSQLALIERAVQDNGQRAKPHYLVIGRGQREFVDQFEVLPSGSLDALDRALARSTHWRQVFRQGDSVIYELMVRS